MKQQVGLSNWSKVVVSIHRKSKLIHRKLKLKQIPEMTKIQSANVMMSLKGNDMTRLALGMIS